jgi:hypothetical protein
MWTIVSLNDNLKWSRDAIADWIEQLDDVPVFQAPEVKKDERPMVLKDGEIYPYVTVLAKRKRVLSGANSFFFEEV